MKRRFPRNKTFADVADDCWQADLADMRTLAPENDNYKYLLCVICVFSKYAWCIPLKNKSAASVTEGFEKLFSCTPRRCTRLVTDKGKEFVNTLLQKRMKKHDITCFQTTNPDTKASVCERFQRTLKSDLYKAFTHRENYRYVDGLLNDILHSYNNRYHTSIKMTPTEASSPRRTLEVYNILYGKKHKSSPPKLKIGDYVRISREKPRFAKGHTWNWSEEIFRIVKVIPHPIPCYKIQDLDEEDVTGSFYEAELIQVSKPERFKIAYIVRSKGKGDSLQHLVHWRGYPEKSRSWVSAKDISDL